MRTVVFDLDGTLADTSGDLIAAANACFRDLGHPDMLDPATDAATALRGGRAMLTLGFGRLGIPEADLAAHVDPQYQPLLVHYGQALAVHTTLYPGALAAVEAQRRRRRLHHIAGVRPTFSEVDRPLRSSRATCELAGRPLCQQADLFSTS